jgi:Phosphodiester glycosidase/FlgD Ig-like domain
MLTCLRVLKRGLLCAALAVVFMLPTPAAAQLLVPGVTHSRERIFNSGRTVVLHIVRTPPPSDLYRLLPVRARVAEVRRETVPAMQRRISSSATTVGVNGDFFNIETGHPTGIFMREGVLSAGPSGRRSAMAVGLDGRLLVDLFGFDATWQAVGDRARTLRVFNQPVADLSRVGLFTRTWGAATPRARGAVELVLGGFQRARLDADLAGTVAAVERGGRTPIPAGGAVLQARGDKRALLRSRGTVGTEITVHMNVPQLQAGTPQALGGGPTLVRNGRVVRQSGQGFSSGHTHVRHPRTAVGQLANGRLLFVVADGRSSQSFGLTTRALATIMANRGAVTAISLDGGGSSTIAFEGRVLNIPSDGRPRRVATGLFLHYYGIFAPAANATILSPNGDGVGDRKTLRAKVVRRSDVTLRLRRPDGSVAWSRRDVVGPRWLRRTVSNPRMVEGVWRWEVEAVETGTGRATDMNRVFRVNKTLGHLRLSRSRLWVKPRRGGRLGVSVTLTRRARLQVLVLGPAGNVRRALFRGELGPGTHAWRWNGKSGAGKVVDAGTYAIRVTARNGLGVVSLRRSFSVLRAPRG